MADATGIVDNKPGTSPIPPGKKGKNRLLLLGGGGVALLLLLSHRGSSSGSATNPNSQLQAQSDALAAEEAAMLNPPVPGGSAPVDTGGGSYTSQGPSATTAPGVTGPLTSPINVTVAGGNIPAPGTGGKPAGGRPAVGSKAGPHGAIVAPYGAKKPAAKAGYTIQGTGRGGWIYIPKVKPKTAAKGKPAPANRGGKHPNTNRRTPSGAKKHSPAEVESVRGVGAGQVVQGREFPGAIAHRMGPPQRRADGTQSRTVTVDYGGHTDTHLMLNNGEQWIDRIPGRNPPSRGVPVSTDPVPV